MTVTELTDIKTTINWLLENGEFKDIETSYNIAMNAVDMLEKQLSIPLVVNQRELLNAFEINERVVYRTGVIGTLVNKYQNGMVGLQFGVHINYVPVEEIKKLSV